MPLHITFTIPYVDLRRLITASTFYFNLEIIILELLEFAMLLMRALRAFEHTYCIRHLTVDTDYIISIIFIVSIQLLDVGLILYGFEVCIPLDLPL